MATGLWPRPWRPGGGLFIGNHSTPVSGVKALLGNWHGGSLIDSEALRCLNTEMSAWKYICL